MGKSSMDLKQMYELKMTPERKVEAFRRFVIRLKQQKSFGQDLSYRDYFRVDTALFREEALYMKDLDAESDTSIRLTKEIRCLEEMTDEQILCYYTLVKGFRRGVMERASMTYARYYMLEVANLIYQETAGEACEVLFAFWDLLNGKKKVSGECTEYFYQICQLFLLAHQEMMPKVLEELEKRSGRDFSGETLARIEQGDYRQAARFISQYARLLKAEEIWSEAAEVRYTREALPVVFERLEERLRDYEFRKVILNGFYASMYMGDYPVKNPAEGTRQTVHLSRYRYYEYQEYSDYWKCWYYVLRESVQDVLTLIWQYTRSCIRKQLKLGVSKYSAARILKKHYAEGTDRPRELAHLKDMAADERFCSAVEEGVLLYLEEQGIGLPKKTSPRTRKEKQEEIDYGVLPSPAGVDPEKLKRAKEDADLVLGMLSEGEIDYEGEAGRKDTDPGEGKAEEPAGWKPEERRYLQLLREGDASAAAGYLGERKIPEQVMIKRINEKSLDLLGDILLERQGGTVRILKDYEEEADRIIRTAES